jgi:hypothetical protein
METDTSHLPQVMSRITVNSAVELKAIWKLTQTVKQNTPYSFGELPDVKRIFTLQDEPMEHGGGLVGIGEIQNV